MIVAIDESGSPRPGSEDLVVFVAAHLRQRKTILRQKREAFARWETSLPRALKDSKGEFKGKALDCEHLSSFARDVLAPEPRIRVTAVILRPSENPVEVVDKHRQLQASGIQEGIQTYAELDKASMSRLYDEFSHWFDNLSYDAYVKVVMLGTCIHAALVNSFGHAIVGGYELELTRLRYLIDKDFVREERSNAFWHEILRNQVWQRSKTNPLPMLKGWKDDHPVIAAYTRNGRFALNRVFVENLSFVRSHEHFEVRLADVIATIMSRNMNRAGACPEAARIVDACLAGRGEIEHMLFEDFDLDNWEDDVAENPWVQPPPHGIHWLAEPPGDV